MFEAGANIMEYLQFDNLGKRKRLYRILGETGKCLIVPLDDNLISGVKTEIDDLGKKLDQILSARPNAILSYQGTLKSIGDYSMPTILNLTSSTINSCHTNKVLTSSVKNAIKLGADAIAVHVNLSSKYESSMLEILGRISEESDRYGIPLMAIIYPRGEIISTDGKIIDQNYTETKEKNLNEYADLVSHCVKVAFELGADIIKTQYTGTSSSFKKVVQSASGKPVLIAGGGKIEVANLFKMVEGAMIAGASGVSIGRNVFGRIDSDKIILGLKKMIFENMPYKEALNYYNNLEV